MGIFYLVTIALLITGVLIFKKTENWEQIKHDRSDVDLDQIVN